MGHKPKKKKSGGSKKKKLSKTEKVKMQQEEEQKRLQEEEEARFKAEKEEAERLAKQQLEKEKQEKLEAKDLERRGDELEELRLLENCYPAAEKWRKECLAQAKWEEFTRCEDTPDPTLPREINTFISLWKEEQDEDIETVMLKGKLVRSLIERLELLLMETPLRELKEKKALLYQESICELRDLLYSKFDVATEGLLKQASTLVDPDSGNMEKVFRGENVTFCIWANIRKNPRTKNVTFQDTEMGLILPKILTSSAVIGEGVEEKAGEEEDKISIRECTSSLSDPMKFQLEESESQSEDDLGENVVDLHQFTPLGGVYHLDVLQLPPQCKQVKGWTLVEMLSQGLKRFPYPQPLTQEAPLPSEDPDPPALRQTSPGSDVDVGQPPITVTLKFNDSAVFFEEPLVAKWDPEGRCWRTDGFGNVYYNMEERQLSFTLESLCPVALMQDTHLNMPYQSWELRPTGLNAALFVVLTTFTELKIQIQGNQCMLISATLEDEEYVSEISGKWMSPLALTLAMRRVGLNIFPSERSRKYVSVNQKSPGTEVKAYQQMALMAPALAFGWSKWNLNCGAETVVLKASEHLGTEPVNARDWSLYMFNGQRAQRLKVDEFSPAFSEDLEDDTEFHSTLYHMLKDFTSEEAMEKVQNAHHLFVDAVYQLLLFTRVLTYS
ncbi:dynein intermediate chain CFAP94, axonemal isoform X2 [Tachyglossus aculeatus]|uniref:dynein intermediate chain CFAP94, axonemal isoform X2 n=1 Tax=Tachyglossus aculeatus TaxID=9261 RepID=UPI0018F37532|nr:dynein intermediate chain CFAP94, axonemal isoform X2 [Tachyglossus aculeatus]